MDGGAEFMSKTAIITGISGQDGYYLAALLNGRGYSVTGLLRKETYWQSEAVRLLQLDDTISADLRPFELNCQDDWNQLLAELQPDEIYHLAGMSFVPETWLAPVKAIRANTEVTLLILEAIRNYSPHTRLFHACSSEIFGRPEKGPQNENTTLRPISPYGVTKAASHHMIDVYRNKYGLFACSGILFNHESPRRTKTFLTRKISAAAAAIATGQQDQLVLGCLDSSRDWGYAVDFVDCMWRMMQTSVARDYVIGTGRLTSIRTLLDIAFEYVDLRWQNFVTTDPKFARSVDAASVYADSTAAYSELGWRAETNIEQLMQMMVEHDLNLCGQDAGHRKAA